MRRTTLFLFTVLAMACGGGGSQTSDEPVASEQPGSTGSEDTSVSSPGGAGRPVTLGADGTPENCPIRVEDLCYDTPEQACAAAACPMERCQIMESYPGQVNCGAG